MYLLDANVFITAARQHFSFDLAPGYWTWLVEQHAAGRLASVAAVRDELLVGDDALSAWAANLPDSFWLHETTQTVAAMRSLVVWASSANRFTPAGIAEFLDSADLRLIAEGYAGRHTVVTHEVSSPGARRRVLIPDACAELKVACLNPWQLHQVLGLRLGQV